MSFISVHILFALLSCSVAADGKADKEQCSGVPYPA